MLTNIVLSDYTTFITKTIFDFQATNYKILEDTNVGEGRVLKGALFVGENASGKTQVLEAIILLLNLLLANSEPDYITKKSLYTKGDKYHLQFTFKVNEHEILYEVGFENNTIDYEKLYLDSELKIERIKKNGKSYFSEIKDNDELDLQLSLVKLEYYNTRFDGDEILNKWFEFLKNSIYINCLHRTFKTYNPTRISEQLLYKYAENNDPTELNKLIDKIGYNSEIVFEEETFNKDKSIIINSDKRMIGLKKKGTNVVLPLPMESAGNQSFLNLLLPIKYATQNNCMIIIDEFSSGLHNELEESLIKYFFNNSNNSQIFFTSHSTNLIDTYILRPDQIYSFKFDNEKGTIIKRFSEENPRESQNMQKMYLSGVFDGLPNYNKEFKD